MLILGLVLAAILLLSITLHKAYFHLPLRELRRRARKGDVLAKQLYKPVAYGMDLRILLGAVSVLSAAGSFLLLSKHLGNVVAFVIIAVVTWAAFMWLPGSRQTAFSTYSAKLFAPALAKALHYLHRPLAFISNLVGKHYHLNTHTGLYSKEDIIDLLEWQKHQPDNQISEAELSLVKNSLESGDKKVSDIFTPAKNVRLVSAAEPISPILIDELHKTGHKSFPVYENKKSNLVGVLELSDLVAAAKRTSPISSIMKHNLSYVHEDFSLPEFVQAITTARQHLFIVINSFEEFVGVVTASDFINQLFGQPAAIDFEDYENSAAVAEIMAKKEAAASRPADIELTEEHLAEEPVEAVEENMESDKQTEESDQTGSEQTEI